MTLRPSATFHLHSETATSGEESQPWFATEASIISALSTIPRLTAFATSLSTAVKASAQESAMDLLIKHEAFAGRRLAVRTAGFFKGPRLIIDGGEVKGKRLRFSLTDNSGHEREIRLKTNGLDPIPRVQIGAQTIELARPLAWYEYLWMAIPIALVLVGGGLGALVGLVAGYSSARILR